MNIAQVCPYDYHRIGGVQLHMRDLSRALIALGHNVTVIAPGPQPDSPAKDGNPKIVHIGTTRDVAFNHTHFEMTIARDEDLAKLDNTLKEGAFDIIHYHTMWVPFVPLQVLRRSKAANVGTFHDTPPETFGGMLTRMVFRLLSRSLSRYLQALIAVSSAPKRHLWCAPNCRLHILPPCTDLSSYFAPAVPFAEKNPQRPSILYLGRLERRKGVAVLVEAAHRLAQDGLKPDILIAGEGPLRTSLEERTKALGLSNVRFLGHVSENDKRRWLATADILCAPSLYGESFGIVLLEAMAAGLSVVAADNTGYSSTLKQTGGGLLAKAGDAGALAQSLGRLVKDESLRATLSQEGRQAAASFDAQALAPRFVEIYTEALALKT